MAPLRLSLPEVLSALEARYGPPPAPRTQDPFELILWENVGYLVDDPRREAAFESLRDRVGLEPEMILAASDEALISITKLGGIFPELRADRLRQCAERVIGEFDGDLSTSLLLPFAQAKKALCRFPDIGDGGAEKILLLSDTYPCLALDSNGLRVLVRLGYGEEDKNYARMYRLAQQEASREIIEEFEARVAAHQLLRLHGKTLCKRTAPLCRECPLSAACPSANVTPAADNGGSQAG
jgi:endonuclease III